MIIWITQTDYKAELIFSVKLFWFYFLVHILNWAQKPSHTLTSMRPILNLDDNAHKVDLIPNHRLHRIGMLKMTFSLFFVPSLHSSIRGPRFPTRNDSWVFFRRIVYQVTFQVKINWSEGVPKNWAYPWPVFEKILWKITPLKRKKSSKITIHQNYEIK